MPRPRLRPRPRKRPSSPPTSKVVAPVRTLATTTASSAAGRTSPPTSTSSHRNMPPALPVCPGEPGGAPASRRRHRAAPALAGGVTVKTFLATSTETCQAGGGAPEARAQRKRAREGNGMAGESWRVRGVGGVRRLGWVPLVRLGERIRIDRDVRRTYSRNSISSKLL